MATRVVDGKRLSMRQLSKRSTTSSPPAQSRYRSNSKKSLRTATPPPPPSLPKTSSITQPSQRLIARTEVTPKTRIVVVRTASSIQDEKGEVTDTEELARSKSVELPPLLTNGRTSVYLIRRPIPPPETPKPTQLFQPQDSDERKRNTTPTMHTDNANNSEDTRSHTPTEEIVLSPDLPSQNHSSSRRPKTSKHRSYFSHSDSPTIHSLDNNHSESPNRLLSSPTQLGNSHQRTRRSRSNSKNRFNSRHRSRSAKRRISPNHRSPTPPIREEPKETDRKRSFFSFFRTKSTNVQAASIEIEQPPVSRKIRRKKPINSPVKSPRSVVLVNPEDQTIAVVENPYVKGDTIKSVMKQQPTSLKRTRLQPDIDSQSIDEFVKTSRWHRCLDCLSRRICLIIIICLILFVIGLAGVGVSAYFLASNSQDNLIPKIVGIAIGGALAIIALCFLYCVLGCIGSRDGYFTYHGDGPRVGGRVFALISPNHPNARNYIPCDYADMFENNSTSISTIQKQPNSRQKTIIHEINNKKNLTIEMPERLLTGKKMSPKTHERKLNKVVNNIGHVVEDAKKRYHGDIPTKVIVKVDENVKAAV